MKKGKIVLMVILLAVVVAVPVIYSIWNKPPVKVEDVEGLKVSVADISRAYAADEVAANEKYLNKAVVVTGTVREVQKNQDGNLLLILEDELQCTMREMNVDVEEGSTVTVKGFCAGSSLFGVLLSNGVIVK